VVILTHRVIENAVDKAIEEFRRLDDIQPEITRIRVEYLDAED
jgi:hypothetical protein